MFAQDDLSSILKSYLDKFPDKGVKHFPSVMSGEHYKFYQEFVKDIEPLYKSKDANLDLTKLLDMGLFKFDPSLRLSKIFGRD